MQMDLVFVGWNHRVASLDLREKLSFTPERAREAMEGLFREKILTEGAVVSTCNRAEIYGLTDLDDSFEALASYFSRFHDVDGSVLRESALSGRGDVTVRHLFRVASGLDSMVLGEAQILGQIRDAHRRATEAGTARTVTHRLFQAALECGKKVRTRTALGTRPTSVPGIALSLVGRIFEEVADCRVLLLGAGETVELTARLLADDGVTRMSFCNRTQEKAAALAAEFGGTVVPWEERIPAFAAADVVLTATGATDPVIPGPEAKRALSKARRRGPLLVLDMAVPRDVDPAVEDVADVYRYDLDAFGELARANAAERQAEVPLAEAIVEESVEKFAAWLASLSMTEVVKQLRFKLEAIRRDELARSEPRLARLDPADREMVERLTEALLNKILHNPTVGLKHGDASQRLELAAAVRTLFKLDGEGRE